MRKAQWRERKNIARMKKMKREREKIARKMLKERERKIKERALIESGKKKRKAAEEARKFVATNAAISHPNGMGSTKSSTQEVGRRKVNLRDKPFS